MSENKTPEFEPPQACVQRVIKAVLPDNVQIGKDAKAAFSRSAGIFIMYLTACANDFCREAKRQTISAQDVMQAIKELEFGELEEPLREYLDHYRREASAKKQIKAAGAVAKKEDAGDMEEADADADEGMGDDGEAGGGEKDTGGEDAQQSHNDSKNGGDAGAVAAAAATTSMDVDRREESGSGLGVAPPASGGAAPMDEDGGEAEAVGEAAATAGVDHVHVPEEAATVGVGENNGE